MYVKVATHHKGNYEAHAYSVWLFANNHKPIFQSYTTYWVKGEAMRFARNIAMQLDVDVWLYDVDNNRIKEATQ